MGALLVIAAVTIPLVFKTSTAPASAPIPRQISGLSLSSEATGSAALREFTRLHGKSFPVLSGSKASYGSGNQVTLWVAGTASSDASRQLLEAMRDKIALESSAGEDSPFQPSGVRNINNREVYPLDGMGQKHFYFQSGKYLIWLAANADFSEQALQEALDFYR